MPVSGNIIRELYLYLDNQGAPAGGMTSPADVTLNLFQDTGSGFVLVGGNAGTGITVSWAPVAGSTGYYTVSYTPTSSGAYVLEVIEIDALASGARWKFPQEVTSQGAVFLPAFANAFCAESDVERWLQFQIDSTTNPNDLETAAFAETRAGVLMSLCGRFGVTVTPATASGHLKTLLRDADAIGTAMDYTAAQILGVQPSRTDRFEYYRQLWIEYVGGPQPGFVTEVVGLIEKEIAGNLVSLSTDHILSGDTQAAPAGTPPTDIGIQLGMGTLF